MYPDQLRQFEKDYLFEVTKVSSLKDNEGHVTNHPFINLGLKSRL